MKYKRLSGIIILVINCFIIYYRRDIIIELLQGRDINELDISELILPTILLIIGFFLLTKTKKND